MDAYIKTLMCAVQQRAHFLLKKKRETNRGFSGIRYRHLYIPCITDLVILLLSRKEGEPLLLGMESDLERDLVLVLDLEREADLL